jgi:hypothetical protein
MENHNKSLLDEERDLEVDRFGTWLTDMWLKNFHVVRSYIEPTVQLLATEGYQAASVLLPGCHLVAFCPDHLLIGYVSKGSWPSTLELDIFQTVPSPAGTKRFLFRWHSLRGIPDRREL